MLSTHIEDRWPDPLNIKTRHPDDSWVWEREHCREYRDWPNGHVWWFIGRDPGPWGFYNFECSACEQSTKTYGKPPAIWALGGVALRCPAAKPRHWWQRLIS